jgi:hypothetical protein
VIDERTGRQAGNHGTANQALEYALDVHEADPGNQLEFLRAWREGDLADEWPDFYTWLNALESPEGTPGVGRTELSAGNA